MEVFLVVKREKTSIFLDVKETTYVYEIKSTLATLLKKNTDDMCLLYKDSILDENKTVAEYGLTMQTTKPQTPALIGLVYRISEMDFEELNIIPVSLPNELPGTMKSQDSPAAGS
ncbi:elongin-B [Hydra vulgaris]|uniref:Elongin-B n=1 Tax=Hydra vulgaris TaxID=6087 RepID=A0ABM4CPM6_HYDVU